MIRFIDLSEALGYTACAFFNTTADRFAETADGHHDFKLEDIMEHSQSLRLLGLLPKNFFMPRVRFRRGKWRTDKDEHMEGFAAVILDFKDGVYKIDISGRTYWWKYFMYQFIVGHIYHFTRKEIEGKWFPHLIDLGLKK